MCICDNAAIITVSPHLQCLQEVESHQTGSLPCSIRPWILNEYLWFFDNNSEKEITLSDSFSHYEKSIQGFKSQEEKTWDESKANSTAHYRAKTDKEN